VEVFPFTEVEWAALSDAALPVVNAGLAGDEVLGATHLVGLLDVLAGLRARYGDHPVLLETEADFTKDDAERVGLYRRAVGIAVAHGLPTLSIRLSLARVLLELGRPQEAAAELSACERELPDGDESERSSWSELAAEASQAELNAAADGGGMTAFPGS
jgi:hypothetical protein